MQPFLADVLKQLVMANTIGDNAHKNLRLILEAIKPELAQLIPMPNYEGSTREKGEKIIEAFNRLKAVIDYKYPNAGYRYKKYYKFDKKQIDAMDNLSTIDTLLNLRVTGWEGRIKVDKRDEGFHYRSPTFGKQLSLKQALDYSRNNPFPGYWGPLWGKTTTWEHVEKTLFPKQSDPIELTH